METYWEKLDRITAPARPHAKKTVDDLGADTALRVSVQSEGAMQYAIWGEVTRRSIEALPDPHDLKALMRDPAMRTLFDLVSAYPLGRGSPQTTIADEWHRYMHHRYGRKVYEVSPRLAQALHHTELRGVTTDALKLPYPAVYIALPSNAGLDYAEPERQVTQGTGTSRVEGVFIAERRDAGAGLTWSFLLIGTAPGEVGGIPNHLVFTFNVTLPPATTIDDLVKKRWEEIDNLKPDIRALYHEPDGMAPLWERYFRYVMNVVLYVTHIAAPEDIEERWANKDATALRERIAKLAPGKKKDDLKDRLRKTPKHERLYVGWKFPEMRTDGPGAEGKPLLVRTLVTGHWRNQAFGTGWQEHKLIWIQPFWRGPKSGDESNPRRIVT